MQVGRVVELLVQTDKVGHLPELLVAPAEGVLDEGVAEAEGGGGECVGHRGVDGVVVSVVVPTRAQAKLEYVEDAAAQNDGQPLVVSDVLQEKKGTLQKIARRRKLHDEGEHMYCPSKKRIYVKQKGQHTEGAATKRNDASVKSERETAREKDIIMKAISNLHTAHLIYLMHSSHYLPRLLENPGKEKRRR